MSTATTGESAPSRLHADEPVVARYAGGIGWGLVIVGLVVVSANRYLESPRLISEPLGWFFTLVGVTLALVHAAVESELLLRRVLGFVGVAFVVVGIAWGAAMAIKGRSWASGLIPAFPGAALITLYLRRELDDAIRVPSLLVIGALGLLLGLTGVLGTFIAPHLMAARFAIPLLLCPLLLLISLGLSRVTDAFAYWLAIGLGGLGAFALLGAILRAVYPTLLYEWRQNSELEHLVAIATGLSLLVLGVAAFVALGKPNDDGVMTDGARTARTWGRIGGIAGVMLLFLGLLRYVAPRLLANYESFSTAPAPYLVPTGIVLIIAGLVNVLIAVGFVSENRLVVLTRREFTAYFVSPIAYCVMAGFVFIATPSYYLFLDQILLLAEHQRPIEEPIVQDYIIAFFPVVAVVLSVPLLTMRLFAEERRSGTLEVLLTAPVSDWLIVLSKWFASWLFFMLLWLPWGLYLLAMRLEGGKEFDVRPMIGFTLGLMACGAAFTAMGMFFSSLTRDQIISAALTLMGMMLLVGFFFAERHMRGTTSWETSVKVVMRALSFIHMWIDTTRGKLFIRDVVVQLSMAVFFVVATAKVLEMRRWS